MELSKSVTRAQELKKLPGVRWFTVCKKYSILVHTTVRDKVSAFGEMDNQPASQLYPYLEVFVRWIDSQANSYHV